MSKSNALRHKDYRAVYWVLGECCELGYTPEAWAHHLFEFFNANMGVHLMSIFEGSADMAYGRQCPGVKDEVLVYGQSMQKVLGLMQDYWESGGINDDPALPAWRKIRQPVATRARQQLVSDADWGRSAIVNEYFRCTGSSEMILSRCPATNERHLLVNLWRPLHEKQFSERDTQLVYLLTKEISILFKEGRLAPLATSMKSLSPRLRQVLDLLNRGYTEKQIAVTLGSSAHTVHNQIHALYRALKVNSRSQLFSHTNKRHNHS